MNITKDKVVSMHYTVKNNEGALIDTSDGKEPLLYMQGHKNIIPGLESEMEGKTVGDKVEATIEPTNAYGEVIEELIQDVPRSAFEGVDKLEVGMNFQAQSEQGPVNVVITNVSDETVTVDGNHPLAGQTLNFNVEVVEVRDATEEELSHGHAHGAGGHQH
ncbi:peptidylprolyl isomerase [Pleionea mediterranea]|jgi:FKBP-type peptidyl-prolyl cis-trans isomerase SlyD|uniref:Peptidyl-prolyl cis-trans isomerase n=1 Tax=Pleionea mediterranea TaxID=523701 RepID=A0A316G8H2_9GAMM|nr:peptidylprolyl isomerase [Pleionea mediterranea]PWK50767.1 FKBP-type peptidyl-prolyl cis-trans isomerase SlyD [Pleionea mediterranea]